ncbi:MFS transporter, partial [Agrobacterium salinitolerans]
MTDTTSDFDGSTIALEATKEPAWTAATWFAVLSMAATSFALVSAEFLPAGLLTPM